MGAEFCPPCPARHIKQNINISPQSNIFVRFLQLESQSFLATKNPRLVLIVLKIYTEKCDTLQCLIISYKLYLYSGITLLACKSIYNKHSEVGIPSWGRGAQILTQYLCKPPFQDAFSQILIQQLEFSARISSSSIVQVSTRQSAVSSLSKGISIHAQFSQEH